MSLPYKTIPEPDDLVFEQVNGSSLQIAIQATEDGDLLRFRNAILAISEVNKNNDEISDENIRELAASLGGRAIDIGHDETSNAGVITAARETTVNAKGAQRAAVAIDGLLWRDRYPKEIDGVRAGTHHLSVEANARKAVCSECKGEFETADMYCSHLKRRNGTGVRRGFRGLTGKGAGITPNPAGTGTVFDREKIFVVAHMEMAAHWYDGLLKEGEAIDDLPASDFADSKGRRFPYKIHGKVNQAGWKAAWSAANGGHTGQKDEGAIAKLKRDKPAGVDISESTQEINAMEHKCPHCGNIESEEHDKCPKCGRSMSAALLAVDLRQAQETLKTKRDELEAALAELDTLKPQNAQLQAQLDAKVAQMAERETALKTANSKLEDIKRAEREAIVRAFVPEEVMADRLPTYLSMDDATFTTVMASLKDASKRTSHSNNGIGYRSGVPDPVAGPGANGKRVPLITMSRRSK